MELIYMYIVEELGVKNLDVNLSGEYSIKYTRDKYLVIKKNENYIDNFFNLTNNNISNISGVIGENGSGKSSILFSIRRLLYNGGIIAQIGQDEKNYFSEDGIIIVKDGERIKIFCSEELILSKENIKIDKSIKDIEIRIYGPNNLSTIEEFNEERIVEGSNILKDMGCIYFSNIFDNTMTSLDTREETNYYDISVNGLFDNINRNTKILRMNNRKLTADENDTIANNKMGMSVITSFKLNQLKNEINYILDNNNSDVGINLPKSITIDCSYVIGAKEKNIFAESTIPRFYNDTIKKTKLEKDIYSIISAYKKNDVEITKKTYLIVILNAYFQEVERLMIIINGKTEEINKIQEENEKSKEINVLIDNYNSSIIKYVEEKYKEIDNDIDERKKMIKFSYTRIKGLNDVTKGYKKLIDSIMGAINLNKECVVVEEYNINKKISQASENGKDKVMSVGPEKLGSLNINLLEDNFEIIKEIIQTHKNISTDQEIFSFHWRNISSGEYALLETYSRIYSLLEKLGEVKAFMLIIDEGELYLHPEWQRKYFYNLIKFINRVFINHNVQIIFTSNTPLVVTDIPRSNLVMLQKEKDDKNEFLSIVSDDMEETFAANINTLLAHSFFMKSSMGEFAKIKINEVIRFLYYNENNNMDENEVRKVINLIGEPIIKNKLLSQCKWKYNEACTKCEKERSDIYKLKGYSKDELKELQKNLQDTLNTISKLADGDRYDKN